MNSVTERRREGRVLNLFLLDTSGSMRRDAKDYEGRERQLIDQLNDGLEYFTKEIGGSEDAERVDIGLVSFGGEVTMEKDFQPINISWMEDGPPTLSAGGHTPMCEAVVRGLNNLESYMVETDRTQERALVWLLTDGKPNETEGSKWEKTKRKIEHRTEDDDLTFYAVGLGEKADMETLGDLVAGVDDENKSVFHLEEGQTREFFMRASESIKQNSENIGKPDYDDDRTDGSYDTICGDTTDDDDQSGSFDDPFGDTADDGSEKSQSENSAVSDREVTEGDDVRVATSAATIGPEIDTGSEGTVYRIQGNSDSVLKIFNKQTREEKIDKVRAMIKNPPIDSTYEEERIRSIIWPQEIAEDPSTGAFLGYKMPYRDLEQTKSALEYAVTELKWDENAAQERYRVAHNLALVVKAIHEQGHAIGDFNHDNILVDEDGFVTLIDCDRFLIHGETTIYPVDTFVPRYMPPEGGGSSKEEVQELDRFGLGVHIFQFLMEGFHPFIAQGPMAANGSFGELIRKNQFPYHAENTGFQPHDDAPNYEKLPADIRELFENCFAEISWGRPEPGYWIKTLNDLITEDKD
ncbi:VWA domain-containing protein [Haloarcula sp. Atlit-120R]|uniref:VWA domain-containing protein n=1 Tax=Haloarcula sp. Atlit-120R TaxID=2282135 RepID=UPI00131424A5|nr:VWA domain-containing protein [Haloarcula sp. Atlit-120R]